MDLFFFQGYAGYVTELPSSNRELIFREYIILSQLQIFFLKIHNGQLFCEWNCMLKIVEPSVITPQGDIFRVYFTRILI